MQQLIQAMVNPIARKLNLIISKCTIKMVDDKTKTQTIQSEIITGEIREKIERWQEYGYTSHPPLESEGLCVFLGGERDRGYIIATENKKTRKNEIKEGEVCIYTNEKDFLHFQNKNKVLLKTHEYTIEDKKSFIRSEELIDIITKDFKIKDENLYITSDKLIDTKTKDYNIKDENFKLESEKLIDIKTKDFNIKDENLKIDSEKLIDFKTKDFNIKDENFKLDSEKLIDFKTKDFNIKNENIKIESDKSTDIKTKEFNIKDENLKIDSEKLIDIKTKEFNIKNEKLSINSSNSTEIKTQKFSVSNGGAELIDILSKTLEALVQANVTTLAGAMPLNNAAIFAELKIKIETFK
ncbi:phage baseplate assembly protein [Silvanigrella aquatica]|uniref:Bacteriophage Mu Gp45 N-terminal domain-containing protein n=1 Tax=Silvanigrella aquatica TaxID=1915309 RepID=A0A1L4D155_9BACT|nr:phage baseplate assembly protein [Silvanigrella aquatica]APJ03943.1 hypothetical protein AXG55_08505 [Silvanigrella aquatica]